MVIGPFYEIPFKNCIYYQWEDLEEHFRDPKMASLDSYFGNPKYSLKERKKILNTTNLNKSQKDFLLRIYDIDYLVLCNNDVYLVEEKEKDASGIQFNRGNFIYLDHGTNTQHQHLRQATGFGIKSGIILKLTKNLNIDTSKFQFYVFEPDFIMKKFYPIQELKYMVNSNKTRIVVDDFIKLGRELGKE
jgi:hypothetical protein